MVVVVVRRGLLGMEETAQRKCTCLPMFRTRWVEELAPAVPTEEPLELNRLAPGLIQALVEQALTAAAMEGSPEVAIMAGTAPNLTLPMDLAAAVLVGQRNLAVWHPPATADHTAVEGAV